jgi:hypothetical protein
MKIFIANSAWMIIPFDMFVTLLLNTSLLHLFVTPLCNTFQGVPSGLGDNSFAMSAAYKGITYHYSGFNGEGVCVCVCVSVCGNLQSYYLLPNFRTSKNKIENTNTFLIFLFVCFTRLGCTHSSRLLLQRAYHIEGATNTCVSPL